MALLLQFPVAAGVEGDPGGGSLAEPVLVLCPDLLVNGGVPGLAGGFGSAATLTELAERHTEASEEPQGGCSCGE